MAATLIVTFDTEADVAQALAGWFRSSPLDMLRTHGAPGEVHLFTPDPDWTSVPFFKDGPPPPLLAQIKGDSAADLAALARSRPFRDLMMTPPAPHCKPNIGLFEQVETPVAGQGAPQPRTAPLSFVVRYFAPVPDAGAFRTAYLDGHPQLLARFPSVRNVLCYLPVAWDSGEFEPGNVILGNEVVFDDVPALTTALTSNVLAELKRHSLGLPPRGRNTHHAMRRQRIL